MTITLGHTTPTARKPHRCDLCSRIIQAGETYDRWRYVGDDGPGVAKECAHCRALIKLHGDAIIWDWHEGYCGEDIREWETGTDEEAALRSAFLAGWRDPETRALIAIPSRDNMPAATEEADRA